MSDRTGGSSSPNYIHRERPENYDEEDEAYSDGEDSGVLRTRAGWMTDREDERLANQDLQLAKSLRTRSETVEKVVASMLNQPPPLQPLHPDDPAHNAPSLSPKNSHGTNSHPHILPNGVRLRMALATLMNDFFARQAYAKASNESFASYLPPGIVPLLPISAYISLDTSSPHHSVSLNLTNRATCTDYEQHERPPARTQAIYAKGVDFSSTPTSRCSRHLYTACTVCAPPASRPQQSSRTSSAFATGGGVTGWQDGGGIGSGLAKPDAHGNLLRRDSGDSTNMVELLTRFLRLSALVAMELGSEAIDGMSSVGGDNLTTTWGDQQHQEASPTKDKGRATSSVPSVRSPPSAPSSPVGARSSREALKQSERERLQFLALRPSRDWYMLCAGLITRAVLEGYMTCGWTGLCALETLMKVGLGMGSGNVKDENGEDVEEEGGDQFSEFDPDDFPTLLESVKVLFPSLRHEVQSPGRTLKDEAEVEYGVEMEDLLDRVSDKLNTHCQV